MKLYIRHLPIIDWDEMHLEVDHGMTPVELDEDVILDTMQEWYVDENAYIDENGDERSVAVGLYIIDDARGVARAILSHIKESGEK